DRGVRHACSLGFGAGDDGPGRCQFYARSARRAIVPVRQPRWMAMAIVLQESLRGLFYAPFYVALARGAYAAAGVDVRFISAPRPGDAARRLFDGSVDVCWGGPMRVMESYKLVPGCDLVSFAEVVTRDPFLLVGRAPRPDFRLADLLGLRVATVAEVPTPWLCLQ